MIVFEVFVNGRRVVRAGAKDLGVLSANVAAVGRLGPLAGGMPADDHDLHLSVGGLTARKTVADEHIDWLSVAKLKIGDEIQIRVTDADRADKPKSRKTAKPRSSSEKNHERQGPTKRSSGRSKTRAAQRKVRREGSA